MKRVAIVFGGDSLEHDISIVTAFLVMENCQKNHRPYLMVYLSRNGVFYCGKALHKKENYQTLNGFHQGHFSHQKRKNYFVTGLKKYDIDAVILCVHGEGAEDGTVGAMFDCLHIPSTFSGVENAAILQNKYLTKLSLKELNIPVVPGIIFGKDKLRKSHFSLDTILKELKAPFIIKPLHLGSSIGVYKCQSDVEIQSHLPSLFRLDNAVLIEETVQSLHEYNVAILGDDRQIWISEVEEVNNDDRVLSFKDKYEEFSGQNSRIIPASIDGELEKRIKDYARQAFYGLSCQGVVRFDFLYDDHNDQLYLNEINTIPGSLAYYLFEAGGMDFHELIDHLVDSAHYHIESRKNKITIYQDSDLMKIMHKK